MWPAIPCGELGRVLSHLAVDATGVGRPVVDLLRGKRLGSTRFLPAVITGGDSESYADGYYRVPKRDLMTWLQVLLQRGQLQIAAAMGGGRH